MVGNLKSVLHRWKLKKRKKHLPSGHGPRPVRRYRLVCTSLDQSFELECKFPLVTAIFVVARGEMCLLKTSRQNSVGDLQGHTLI